MLRHVVATKILDRLQHSGSTCMVDQSHNHNTWTDIQDRDMVAIYF